MNSQANTNSRVVAGGARIALQRVTYIIFIARVRVRVGTG